MNSMSAPALTRLPTPPTINSKNGSPDDDVDDDDVYEEELSRTLYPRNKISSQRTVRYHHLSATSLPLKYFYSSSPMDHPSPPGYCPDFSATSSSLSIRSAFSTVSDDSSSDEDECEDDNIDKSRGRDDVYCVHQSVYTKLSGNSPLCLPISGPAKYIASLFPMCAPPVSTRLIESILMKTRLSPSSSISLAACIIDCLSMNFYRKWLNTLPYDLESAHPEIILVSALCISAKFVCDSFCDMSCQLSAFHQSLEQFNLYAPVSKKDLVDLERKILQDINYDIYALLSNQGLNFMSYQFQKHGAIYDYSLIDFGISPYSMS